MNSKPMHQSPLNIQSVSTPTVIKTSKQWVLPPRPRPGRKPNSAGCQQTQKKEPKKSYKKKSDQSKADKAVINPIEIALKKIKDENQSLKVELSKLVSDLKALQEQTPDEDDHLIHKKRSESVVDSEEDETSSQISTPSLMSSSSYMSASTSSLDSIKEEQTLKIDDFLTTSFFESSSNSITSDFPPSLPSLKAKKTENAFEFNFLKQESMKQQEVMKNEGYDPLFQSVNPDAMDVDIEFWSWK